MGLPKFSGPLGPVPSYLDPSREIKDPPAARFRPYEFALFCIAGFIAAGAPLLRAFQLAAAKVLETGWGSEFRGWNLGGVKASKAWALAYKKRTGRNAPFYRAHGNVGTGDGQTVVYRGYDSAADFFAEWMHQFVPRPKDGAASLEGKDPATADYRLAGERFWGEQKRDWFAAMVAAGYRGPVTEAHPDRAIAGQNSLAQDMREVWAQHRLTQLGVAVLAVDGVWGPKSIAATRKFQGDRGLVVSGTLDDATLRALA